MSTTAIVITIVTGVPLVALMAGIVMRRRSSAGRTHPVAGNDAAHGAAGNDTSQPADSTVVARDHRIERVKEAYESGEIDERMIGTAARVLGIDKEEARRRIEGASATGAASVDPAERERRRAKSRAQNRKKNKQSKKSRQANRR